MTTQPTNPPQALPETLTQRRIRHARYFAGQRWRALLLIALGFTLAVALGQLLVAKPKYSATARLTVSAVSSGDVSASLPSAIAAASSYAQDVAQPDVLAAAGNIPTQDIKVVSSVTSQNIDITATANSPETAIQEANTVAAAYVAWFDLHESGLNLHNYPVSLHVPAQTAQAVGGGRLKSLAEYAAAGLLLGCLVDCAIALLFALRYEAAHLPPGAKPAVYLTEPELPSILSGTPSAPKKETGR